MENQWLTWAKRLEALSTTGSHFTSDSFDRERYGEIRNIACTMMSALGNVPLHRIDGLVSDSAEGYVTPKVDVRGAIIRADTVLLARESTDGLWTLPGGFADVGLSPSENILKEIEEESGILAEVIGLYSIRHKAKQPYEPDLRDFYKMFFPCRQTDEKRPSTGHETDAVGYFSLNELPPLSKGRVVRADIEAAFSFQAHKTGVIVD